MDYKKINMSTDREKGGGCKKKNLPRLVIYFTLPVTENSELILLYLSKPLLYTPFYDYQLFAFCNFVELDNVWYKRLFDSEWHLR
jgi:hypothetical protein